MTGSANANAGKNLSDQGVRNLQRNEGLRLVYYNDTANNCTYGVGTLAHMGPCTAVELGHPVSGTQVQASLARGIQAAERIVRASVPDHELTQEQFDAAVSFAYNVPKFAPHVFQPANRGDMRAVARNIGQYIYEHPHDAHGHVSGPKRRNQGLVNRRQREAAPFLIPAR